MTPSAAALLRWYDRHHRHLPWRIPPGQGGGAPDPYRIWLSEVMLQQTTAAAVAPRFLRFLARFPSVEALAAAPESAVMEEWAGLGYYARARNLHACARQVAAAGGFPRDPDALRALPGIGAYTAAAIAAIAFGVPVVPVDGNVERVIARVFAVTEPLPGARTRLARLAQGFLDQPAARERPGDFAQALFDLGATLCTPRKPACALCPWREGEGRGRGAGCAAQARGAQEALPRRPEKQVRPHRHGAHFLLSDPATGRILLRRRPPEGLLGGMLELPGTPWRAMPWGREEALAHAPLPGLPWRLLPGTAEHGFTHFTLDMTLYAAALPPAQADGARTRFAEGAAEGWEWRAPDSAAKALPTAMRRLLALAAQDGTALPPAAPCLATVPGVVPLAAASSPSSEDEPPAASAAAPHRATRVRSRRR